MKKTKEKALFSQFKETKIFNYLLIYKIKTNFLRFLEYRKSSNLAIINNRF